MDLPPAEGPTTATVSPGFMGGDVVQHGLALRLVAEGHVVHQNDALDVAHRRGVGASESQAPPASAPRTA